MSVPAVRRAEAELLLLLILLNLCDRFLFDLADFLLVLEAIDVESGAARHRLFLLRVVGDNLLTVVVLLAGALDAGDDGLVRLDELARPARQSGSSSALWVDGGNDGTAAKVFVLLVVVLLNEERLLIFLFFFVVNLNLMLRGTL